MLLVVMTSLAVPSHAAWLQALAQSAKAAGKALAISYLSSSDGFERAQRLQLMAAGALILPSPDRLVAALGQRHSAGQRRPGPAPQATGLELDRRLLAGHPVHNCRRPLSIGRRRRALAGQGYPVVLKVASADDYTRPKPAASGVSLRCRRVCAAPGRAWWQAIQRPTHPTPESMATWSIPW